MGNQLAAADPRIDDAAISMDLQDNKEAREHIRLAPIRPFDA